MAWKGHIWTQRPQPAHCVTSMVTEPSPVTIARQPVLAQRPQTLHFETSTFMGRRFFAVVQQDAWTASDDDVDAVAVHGFA